MSLSIPPYISEQAQLIQSMLEEWVEERGGVIDVLPNMNKLWQYISSLTEKPTVLIVFGGETPRGSFDVSNRDHRVDRQWFVVVLRGHGFRQSSAETGEQGEEPFYDCVETLRDMLRASQSISEEFPIDYKGIRPLPAQGPNPTANVFMDSYTIEFTTANDLPAVYRQQPS